MRWLIILFVCGQLVTAHSQVLLEENFTFLGPLASNGWTPIAAAGTSPINAASPGLVYPSLPSSGVGNAASISTTGEDDRKLLNATDSSGSIYSSCLLNLSAAQASGDYFYALSSSTSGFIARVFARSSGAGFQLGILKSSGGVTTPSYDTNVLSFGTTYLIATKIERLGGTTTDDVASLWVNPPLGASETSATVTNSAGNDLANIDSIVLRQGSAVNAPTLRLGNILVGTSWEAVTPATPCLLEIVSSKAPFNPSTAANWSSGGNTWVVDITNSHDGVDSIRAQTTNGQSTYREYTVTGPAVVDFWWKVSSEQLYDTFSYSVNATNQETISGEVDWTYRTLTLPEGANTIRWTYAKDGSDAVGQDAGWLDDFAVYPAIPTLRVREGTNIVTNAVTVDYGTSGVGGSGFSKTLNFANEGYVPMHIDLSLPTNSAFGFAGGSKTTSLYLDRGENADLPISLSTQSSGTKTALLTISAPQSSEMPPQVTLTGYISGPIIGVFEVGTPITVGQINDMGFAPRAKEFTIRNDGVAGNLEIGHITTSGSFQVVQQPTTNSLPSQGSTTFTVLAQSVSNGVQSGSVVISSSDPDTPTFAIPLVSKSLFGPTSELEANATDTSGSNGAIGWDFAQTLLPDGSLGNALKTGATPHSAQSKLRASFTSRGLLSWKWKVSAQEGFDWMSCDVSGGTNPAYYSDNTNDAMRYAGGQLDFVAAEVSETSSELIFKLTVNGDAAVSAANLMIGIANGKNLGSTNWNAGNGLPLPITIESPLGGMTHWIQNFSGQTALRQYDGANWFTTTNQVALAATNGPQSTITVSLAKSALGFTRGDVIYFDAYSMSGTYAGIGQMTDALSNPNPATTEGYWYEVSPLCYTSSIATGISRYPRGGEVASVSTKTATWREQVVYVPPNGTVEWAYKKDASGTVGEDAGYITDVQFWPFTAPQYGYAEWWAEFGRLTPPSLKSLMTKSGLPAVLSWVGGFDPDTAPDATLYRLFREDNKWKLRLPISKRYAGGSVSAEFVTNLTNSWSGAGVSQTLQGQNADTAIIEVTAPSGTTGGFIRLNVR